LPFVFSTMLTFDTGSNWGVQKSAEELRQERQERKEELAKIAEETRLDKIEKAKIQEERWAREAKEAASAAEAAEKENQKQSRQESQRAAQKKAKSTQQMTQQMTEVQKIEEALKAVKKAKQERSNAMQRAARNTLGTKSSSSSSSSEPAKPRGRVRVNPVTGALVAVSDNTNDGKVQEGCLRLDKKYMSGALAAGLGGGNGMYGHIGTIQKTFNSKSNTGGRPRNGPSYGREAAAASTGRSTGKGSMSRVMATKVGGTTVHSITSKTSNPSRKNLKRNPNFNRRSGGACDLGGNPIRGDQKRPPKNNVKRMVQGRSSSVKSNGGSGNGYLKSKGVVATLGGATSASTQRYQDKKAQEKEAGRRSERLGSRSSNKPRRQGESNTLGGASSAAPKGNAAALRAARLAALERRGIQ
jgi:hypothetical protein